MKVSLMTLALTVATITVAFEGRGPATGATLPSGTDDEEYGAGITDDEYGAGMGADEGPVPAVNPG